MNDNRITPLDPASSVNYSNKLGSAVSTAQKKDPALASVATEKPVNYAQEVNEAKQNRETQPTTADSAAQKEKDEAELNQAVTKLNDYIQSVQRDLEFNVDKDSGKMVVKVIDRNTDEVVRQMPDELALRMAQNLHNQEPLGLFTTKI